MAEYKGPNFVGITEYIKDGNTPNEYSYCMVDTDKNYTDHNYSLGVFTPEDLGVIIANKFDKDFRQKISYEPPKKINESGLERGLSSVRYHRLSILEQDKFERSVLGKLKEKE